MKTSAVLSGLLWLMFPLSAFANGIVIDVAPPEISRHGFDPRQPPAEMPELVPPEVGTCVFKFECRMETQAEGSHVASPTVGEVKMRTRLVIAIWTPLAGPARVRMHEEAHRRICELYYQRAEGIAGRIALGVLGRRLADSTKRGMERELDTFQKQAIAEYLRETATRCEFAQQQFDAITNHSINPIPVQTAITQAIAAEQSFYAKVAPTRRPVVRVAPTRPAPAAYSSE